VAVHEVGTTVTLTCTDIQIGPGYLLRSVCCILLPPSRTPALPSPHHHYPASAPSCFPPCHPKYLLTNISSSLPPQHLPPLPPLQVFWGGQCATGGAAHQQDGAAGAAGQASWVGLTGLLLLAHPAAAAAAAAGCGSRGGYGRYGSHAPLLPAYPPSARAFSQRLRFLLPLSAPLLLLPLFSAGNVPARVRSA
jgi:hypothetical protein